MGAYKPDESTDTGKCNRPFCSFFCLVTWPLNESEAGGDIDLIETSLFLLCQFLLIPRPFAANDHVVQNPPCWRASSLLFPQWDIKTKASQASLVQVLMF